MLKRVVFIWGKEEIIKDMAALLRELEEKHVEACVMGADSDASVILNAGSTVQANENGSAGTLYITDNALWQKRLWEKKLPVIIYLHEGNREENFMLAEYAIERIAEIELESLELAYLRLTGQPWTILTTDRCIIRETTIDDVDSFYEIYQEPSITEYMEGLYADKQAETAYIQDYIKNIYRFYGYGMWTVLEKTDGKVIGRAGINWREGYDIPELGFVIGVPWQRQGYACEVCQAILAYGKEELGFTDFQALIMTGNEKSRTLCEKLGFVYQETVEVDRREYMRLILRFEQKTAAKK